MRTLLFIALLPFSLIYLVVTGLRNHLYNIGYTKSFHFETKVISVGNLNAGGSGKTPLVELIINILSPAYQVAALSRGYKRKSRGFRMAATGDSAETLGDEPYQFYRKYGDKITVAVEKERAWAIPQILFERPETQAIILDDAFQHRTVIPDLNILVTDYARPFYTDFILPSGRLREGRRGARRADLVVIAKCPANITEAERNDMRQRAEKYLRPGTPVFFSTIDYQKPQPVFPEHAAPFTENILLVSGIANPRPLIDYVSEKYRLRKRLIFPDHFDYNKDAIRKITDQFDKMEGEQKTLLTTEKDMVKFVNLQAAAKLKGFSFYYLPISVRIIGDGKKFEGLIREVLK